MVRVEVTKTIKASKEEVFQKLFDYERLPEFSTIVNSTKILKREGNVLTVAMEGKIFGKNFKTVNKVVLTPPDKVMVEIIEGDATGSQVWALKETTDGTSITVISDITPKGLLGRLLSGLAKGEIENSMEKEFEALKRYLGVSS